MKISIVVPIYNVEQYLSGCVDSILANDLTDCEVLLVDDGSPDRCGEICEQYAARHPGLISVIHQENGGLGAARNAGIEAARGEWLLFLDSDDTLTPDALAVLKCAAVPGVQVVGFQFYTDDGQGTRTSGDTEFPDEASPFLLKDRPEYLLSLPSAVFRLWDRQLFMRSGIRFPSGVWYEDIRTTVKLLALAEGIRVVPDRLYCYLQRPGSIMSSRSLDRNREILDAFDDILGWYRAQGLYDVYETELCALTVKHLLLAASVRVARADPRHPLLKTLRERTDREFPDWPANPYVRGLPKRKALALRLVKLRQFRALSLLFHLKG